MSHPNNKDVNPVDDIKTNVNSRQKEHNQISHRQSIPIKQTNIHRSCLKRQSDIGTGRVSFAQATLTDGKIVLTSQSQNDLIEKQRRSAVFAKKAKELQIAELNYFKDHARDKESIDE
jgi:hypothetical protein